MTQIQVERVNTIALNLNRGQVIPPRREIDTKLPINTRIKFFESFYIEIQIAYT